MITNLYTVYDQKAEYYTTPFVSQNDKTLTRTMTQLRNDPDSKLGQNPADFTVFHFGTFDDETADLTLSLPLKTMFTCHELPLYETAQPTQQDEKS